MNPFAISAKNDPAGEAYCPLVSRFIHEMSESFGQAIDAKDQFTKNHSDEVAVVAHALALAMGCSAFEADVIHIAGHLHDIGKIGVPDCVLAKPGPLSWQEKTIVNKHPEIGAAILRPIKDMRKLGVPELILCHHERYDGSGYPRGLGGLSIPLGARIIAVADSLSAMLQARPYRQEEMPFDAACLELANNSGRQFDTRVVSALFSIKDTVCELITCTRMSDTVPYVAAGPQPCPMVTQGPGGGKSGAVAKAETLQPAWLDAVLSGCAAKDET